MDQDLAARLIQLLDTWPHAAGIVQPDGGFLFLNRAAHRAMRSKGGVPCPPFVEHVRGVQSDRRPRQAVVAPPDGRGSWHGRFWPLEDAFVAFVGTWVPAAERPVEALALRLGIDLPAARLALAVADGRSNHAIAERLGVTPGTVGSRLHRLYRHLGLNGRAELAALVTKVRSTADPT